ncbi:MAG: aspartate/glutamate racemase family protein [Gemmobacter sp.]|nr:aspartate/glutamate racemase family protein [Gemmobacter sp.]
MSDPIRPYGAPGTNVIPGGKALYGAPLGILMLEARFARVYGEMGNAQTWPFPVVFRIVRGASPDRVVCDGARGLLGDFVDAARDLVDLGAEAITTNCGFLSIYQQELAAAVGVPVATSSMMQVPWVQATLPPGKRAGIVTINAAGLGPAHLDGIGVPRDTPVAGTEGGVEFFRTIIKAEKDDLDLALACADVVAAAQSLVAANPDVGAIVLECTNMSPYSSAVQAATGLPVYDIYSMITWFHAGLRPRRFA